MIKSKYSKDNLYLRALEREKAQQRIKESNKEMRKIVDHSREQIKHFQRLRKNNIYHPDTSFKSPKVVKSFNGSEQSNYSDDSYIRNKIMQPITSKADEYEKAIQQFLGVGQAEISVEKLRKGKKKVRKIVQLSENRPRSSVDFIKAEAVKDSWSEELKIIEAKERTLQRNLHELSKKQKSMNHVGPLGKMPSVKVHNKSFKVPLKPKKKESDIFKSLEQVNKLLTNFLKNSVPQVKTKKK